METFERKECLRESQIYSHGSGMCDEEHCEICIEGRWVDKGRLEASIC